MSSTVHPAAIDPEQLLKDCTVAKGRSQGPGGQHRNKVSTHITITHTPTNTTAQAGERRSAAENEKVALSRLRHTLALTIRQSIPIGEIRSDLWISRTKNGKIICSPAHHDYPAMLALALDVLEACNYEPKKAALRLDCSSSQLLKLLAAHPPAFVLLNANRAKLQLHPLKH